MVFTSTLLIILNSNYWLYLIIIFYVYNSKIHFVYAIPFIFIFLVLIVTSSHTATVSLFFSQHNGVVSPSPLLGFFSVSSLPISVTTHSDCCLQCFDHLVVAIDAPNRFFRTDASIGSGRQLQKFSRLHGAVAASPRDGATALPRRWQDLLGLHWKIQWLWIPCWLLYFEFSPSFLLIDECNHSFGSLISF